MFNLKIETKSGKPVYYGSVIKKSGLSGSADNPLMTVFRD